MPNTRQLLFVCLWAASVYAENGNTGIFSNSADVGDPPIKGSAEFSNGEYRVTGSGANIWGKRDEFQYVWREMAGNFTAQATVRFLGKGPEHRKAGIMVRQSLDPDATYADVLMHGSGMPALQWRTKPAEETNAFDLPFDGSGALKLKLVRTGVKIYMYVGKNGAEPQRMVNTEVSFRDPVLVGLVVCAHQANTAETAVFSDVSVEQARPVTGAPQ